MNVAVIGAGWAGLSAAFELHDRGHQVTVFEAGHRLGGRARGLHSPKLDASLDNGQHIMLGAYTDTLALMRRLGLDPDELLYSMPLALQSASGDFHLRVPAVPDALALPSALLCAKGVSWSERWRLATLMSGLARREWKVGSSPAPNPEQGCDESSPRGLTVAEWLARGRQSPQLIRNFWEPLCLASMNTPIDVACAQLFANVLRDSLGAGPKACRVLIPRVDLSALWPERLPPDLSILRGHTVRQLDVNADNVQVDDRSFDAAVIATNIPSAQRLLSGQHPAPGSLDYLATLDAFEFLPISTLTLELSERWEFPHAMLMLSDAPERGRFGQWLFHCNEFLDAPLTSSRLNVVISHATELPNWSTEQIVKGVIAQITEQAAASSPLPTLRAYELISEKRATFAALPDLKRPTNRTAWRRLYVAGDWTDTAYPAVLEGAVRSGLNAGRALHTDWLTTLEA